ncbi:urease accessory protein UreE [Francisella philomiragia]|uniref:urease accessory protein UreE n=1 Tax=Francisella philomiragia TaxID=28110 RepID=UPI001C9DC09C|nr:hypothetical protein [Francisella philomiragia]MBY7734181.1 hypothetical protein [Francisella philomiragia]
MIKKVREIRKNLEPNDSVELSWFDMQKPNLTATTQNGVDFIIKIKFTHLHDNDILVCEDGYSIIVRRLKDDIYKINFSNPLSFAKIAYEIGNRHQPICIEEYSIKVLDDISLDDIIQACKNDQTIQIVKTKEYFRPNGKAHHSH